MSGRISDYSKYLSKRCLRRKGSAIRVISRLASTPGMISLAGGLPNPSLFPISNMSITLQSGKEITIEKEKLQKSLQYSDSYGLPDLTNILSQLTLNEHPNYPLKDNWKVIVTTGSQDALSKAFDSFLNEGDALLLEDPTYSGALASLFPINPNFVPIKTDRNGIIPSSLKENLDRLGANSITPKILYTIPTGQNPSGSTLSVERKKEIYAMASEYDFLILEDDPYWFLRFDSPDLQSFFNLDTDGRVIRFDSFSKVLSSGMRLGWASGPSDLIEKIQLDQQATCLHTSGVSQMMAYSVLNDLGEEGWKNHISRVQSFYKEKRDIFCSLLDKHLSDVAIWDPPQAGMFLWLNFPKIKDTAKLMEIAAKEKKVLMVPGVAFSPLGEPSSCVRASFSTASREQMEEALLRLRSAIDDQISV